MKFLPVLMLISSLCAINGCKKNTSSVVAPAPVLEEPLPARTIISNVAYANANIAQKLDIYTPAAKPPFPVVVMIHGGGWVMGDKQEYATSIKTEALLSRGYAVVAVNYRLSGVAKFPAQIQDVKAAVRFIRAHSAIYKLNANKIGAWGTSAGGHLTALLATSGGINSLDNFSYGDSTQSSKVQAAVDWFGPTDFLQMDAQSVMQGCGAGGHNLANSPESMLMGYPIQTQPLLVQVANPITYISNDDPPIYIAHGMNDCTVPRGQAQIFYDALIPVKGTADVKLNFLTSSGHGTGQFENVSFVNIMVDFFDKYLK